MASGVSTTLGGNLTIAGWTLNNAGSMTWANGLTLDLCYSAVVDNESGASLTLAGAATVVDTTVYTQLDGYSYGQPVYGTVYSGPVPSITNAGAMTFQGGGTGAVNLASSLTNLGTATLDAGAVTATNPLSNSGTFTVDAGTVTATAGGTNSGAVALASADLEFAPLGVGQGFVLTLEGDSRQNEFPS